MGLDMLLQRLFLFFFFFGAGFFFCLHGSEESFDGL
jgi:hypothetical protein